MIGLEEDPKEGLKVIEGQIAEEIEEAIDEEDVEVDLEKVVAEVAVIGKKEAQLIEKRELCSTMKS